MFEMVSFYQKKSKGTIILNGNEVEGMVKIALHVGVCASYAPSSTWCCGKGSSSCGKGPSYPLPVCSRPNRAFRSSVDSNLPLARLRFLAATPFSMYTWCLPGLTRRLFLRGHWWCFRRCSGYSTYTQSASRRASKKRSVNEES